MYRTKKTSELYQLMLLNSKQILENRLVNNLRMILNDVDVECYRGQVSVCISNNWSCDYFVSNREFIIEETLLVNHSVRIPYHLKVGDILYFEYDTINQDIEFFFNGPELYDSKVEFRNYILSELSTID